MVFFRPIGSIASHRISLPFAACKGLICFAHIFIFTLMISPLAASAEGIEIGIQAGEIELDGDGHALAGVHLAVLTSYRGIEWGGGVEALTSDDDGVWLGADAILRYPIGDISIALHLGAGWHHEGDDFALAHPFGFKQQIALGYQLSQKWRISVNAAHFSNAGLADRNPGTEMVTLQASYRVKD